MAAVGVIECLGELADHLQTGLQDQLAVPGRHEVVEALPVLAVLEDDRRAGQQLVAVLLGPNDPVVGDALQRQVLAVRGALDGLPLGFGGCSFGEVDPDPAGVVSGQGGIAGEVVLPGGAGVELLRLQFVGADAADLVQARDAYLLQQPGELFREGRRDTAAVASRRLVEQARPDAVETGLVFPALAAVDALALELVEVADEVLRGKEDGRLDARDGEPGVQVVGGPLQLASELLGLLVGEVERVVDRPGRVAVAEQPGIAVVRRAAGVALDLDEEQATGSGDEQVDLADVAVARGERERLPGAIRLGLGHPRLDVVQGVLLPREAGLLALPAR